MNSQEDSALDKKVVESYLRMLAQKVCNLGLAVPVVFLLEAHKPLTSILHASTLMLEPMLTPIFGLQRIQPLERILADRENIDLLILFIEQCEINNKQSSNENVVNQS